MKNNKGSQNSATFVVRVNRKPGETWYGDLQWTSGQSRQKFENVQELLELMDRTLNSSDKYSL